MDSHLIQSIQDLIVNASKQNGSKSNSNSNHTTTSIHQSGNTKSTQRPLLSTMSPAHPTAIMTDNPVKLFDEVGVFQGTINKSTYKMNFHKWGVNAPVPALPTTTTATYNVSKSNQSSSVPIAFIDRGANGIVARNNCTWIGGLVLPRSVSITGIDNHQMKNIPVGTVGAVSQSQQGSVICVFHEATYTDQHQSILSSFQMEQYGLQVDDKNPAVGGLRRMDTPDGYIFPLSYKSRLAYLKMQPFTTNE